MATRSRTLVARLLILLLALATIFLLLDNSVAADEPVVTETYVVQSGDTLWSIARVVAEPGQDLRAVIDRVKEMNDLDISSIQVGQRLLLPLER